MTNAQTLLDLQELDIEIARAERELKELPELKELARKRAAHQKLKREATRLEAVCKDLSFELEDIATGFKRNEQAVNDTQAAPRDLGDYREVQRLEQRLSDLAKQLDKLTYSRDAKEAELAEARERADAFTAKLRVFERAMLKDAEQAKARATEIQDRIAEQRAQRDKLARSLGPELAERYEQALVEHKGLAVERLVGAVPSICRMTLTESSLNDLSRAGSITTCPYCHRILVRDDVEEDA